MLKKEDLKEGEMYAYMYGHKDDELTNVIGRCTRSGTLHADAVSKGRKYAYWKSGIFSASSSWRLANEEEKEWLTACLTVGKYVDPKVATELNKERLLDYPIF